MHRLSRALIWLLLVPYFAVASLNVAPWIGEKREDANRTNAQLAVSLIFAFTVLGVLSVSGVLSRLNTLSPVWIGLATVVPPMVAISFLLNREREHHYSVLYRSMPKWERAGFGLTTLVFTSVMIWFFFSKTA
jgi:lipopolysaccharide export LptBFGC system permease protein LptF